MKQLWVNKTTGICEVISHSPHNLVNKLRKDILIELLTRHILNPKTDPSKTKFTSDPYWSSTGREILPEAHFKAY